MTRLLRIPSVFHHYFTLAFLLWLAISSSFSNGAFGFILSPAVTKRRIRISSCCGRIDSNSNSNSSPVLQRRNVEIPLLDLSNTELENEMIQPLPAAHLPDELSTLNVYAMLVSRALHKMVVDDAIERSENTVIGPLTNRQERIFGHIAYKTDPDSLIGAIGCAAEVLIKAQQQSALQKKKDAQGQGHAPPDTVLCRGSFRFIVREVVKTIPFPVAIVDELVDGEPGSGSGSGSGQVSLNAAPNLFDVNDEVDDAEDDDDEDDEYADLSPPELVQRTLIAMKQYVDDQLNAKPSAEMSPLEQAIIQDGFLPDANADAQRQAAEEMAAVFDVFQSSLVDLFVMPKDRYFAIAFMAAEMANMSNQIRRQCLATTDGLERLRLVLRQLEFTLGMSRARKLASQITDLNDKSQRDLKVGAPTLPAWAKQIRKGMRVEYFWNEEYEWCEGEVVEEPLLVVDELLLTVHFASDGTTHRLPFSGEDKARWRPPQMKRD